jgi:hypothetical protein
LIPTEHIIHLSCAISKKESEKPCEDAVHERALPNGYAFALSDGAGGTGIFANRWAKRLVESVPKQPLHTIEETTQWLLGFSEEYISEIEHKVISNEISRTKFDLEGSYASFAAVWTYSSETQSQYWFDWLTVGDSACFIYDKQNKTLKIQPYLENPIQFTYSPNLINCFDTNIPSESFCAGKKEPLNGKIVLLASDALAQFIYFQYLVRHNKTVLEEFQQKPSPLKGIVSNTLVSYNTELSFEDLLYLLKGQLTDENNFKTFLYQLCDSHIIAHDDYSLIWIELNQQ